MVNRQGIILTDRTVVKQLGYQFTFFAVVAEDGEGEVHVVQFTV